MDQHNRNVIDFKKFKKKANQKQTQQQQKPRRAITRWAGFIALLAFGTFIMRQCGT